MGGLAAASPSRHTVESQPASVSENNSSSVLNIGQNRGQQPIGNRVEHLHRKKNRQDTHAQRGTDGVAIGRFIV